MEQVDAIIIGAGQSGPSLAADLANAGRKVVLIERERLGGTCVNNGCIPTKTLVASARMAHMVRRAGDFGLTVGAGTVDMAAVKARKDAVVQQSRDSLASWLGGTDGLEVIIGEARFTGERAITVNGRALAAPLIVINTGGRPVRPDWPGIADIPVLTNIEMMDMARLPAHLVIVGGSYIGLEFAQMYRRFGARVTVVESSERIIAREDPHVSQAVMDVLAGEGVVFHLSARHFGVTKTAGGFRLGLTAAEGVVEIDGSDLLAAIGRTPNVEALALDVAGVKQDARGYITVGDDLQTSVPGIYAMGDVNGRGAFTHTSYNDYEILSDNLLGRDTRSLKGRNVGYALYTDPPLGRVGMSEAQAKASGRPVLKAFMPMTRVGRARERGETTGFLSVLADADSRLILGASLFGIEADEVIHLFINAMGSGLSCDEMRKIMPIHPTVSELIPTLLGQLKPL
jgi:pyruvate/2-oxoglutarate dehydrogenase complex dihydrolipoamide dehydrogenase (E3) component